MRRGAVGRGFGAPFLGVEAAVRKFGFGRDARKHGRSVGETREPIDDSSRSIVRPKSIDSPVSRRLNDRVDSDRRKRSANNKIRISVERIASRRVASCRRGRALIGSIALRRFDGDRIVGNCCGFDPIASGIENRLRCRIFATKNLRESGRSGRIKSLPEVIFLIFIAEFGWGAFRCRFNWLWYKADHAPRWFDWDPARRRWAGSRDARYGSIRRR